jgi:predicted hotdog family 3-hydroxylacyl-ACP dehydratase
MQLDRAWIASRIPHKHRMCLLDRVVEWDEDRVICIATSHRDVHNPLIAHGRLGAVCGIEYAAQAMAVHGALLAPGDSSLRIGYLISVRDVALNATRLDDVAGDLEIEALRITGDGKIILYRFSVRGDRRELLGGRATVAFDADRASLNSAGDNA